MTSMKYRTVVFLDRVNGSTPWAANMQYSFVAPFIKEDETWVFHLTISEGFILTGESRKWSHRVCNSSTNVASVCKGEKVFLECLVKKLCDALTLFIFLVMGLYWGFLFYCFICSPWLVGIIHRGKHVARERVQPSSVGPLNTVKSPFRYSAEIWCGMI